MTNYWEWCLWLQKWNIKYEEKEYPTEPEYKYLVLDDTLDYIGIIFKKFRKILWNYLTNVPRGGGYDIETFARHGQKSERLRFNRYGGFGRFGQSRFEGFDVGKGCGRQRQSRRLRRNYLQRD